MINKIYLERIGELIGVGLLLLCFSGCATPQPPQPLLPPKVLFYHSYEANETLTEYFHKGEALKKEHPDMHITGRYIDKYTGKDKFVNGW